MAKKIEKALVFKLPKIIKPYVTNNQTMCSFTTSFICTDTLIILDSPLCEGVFRSEN